MASPSTTPPSAAPQPQDAAPPPAPSKASRAKKSLQKHEAWAQFVGGMETMPVDDARKLQPKDIGVQMGPVMDEAQFEAYRKARAGQVRVIT